MRKSWRVPGWARLPRAPRSVLTHLIVLIVAVLMPLLILNGFLVLRAAEHEQNIMLDSARYRTRIAANAIEQGISSVRAQLFVLAGRLSLQTSDLNAFQDQAKEEFGQMAVVLTSAEGREIINTSTRYGDALPDNPDKATIRYVVENQLSRISDLTVDPVTHRPSVTIAVPVTRDSRLVYVLSLDITQSLPRILSQLDLPDGWIATVFDREGHLIGRSREADRFVGQMARPDFLHRIQTADEDVGTGLSLEGVPMFSAFAHTRLGGWTISASIPQSVLFAPVRQTQRTLILAACLTVALAACLAVLIGKRIARPVSGLVAVAEAVGKGEPVPLLLTPLTEANEVAHSVFRASERLRQTAAEREAATAALADSEQMHRALAADLALVDQERTALLNRMVVAQENERKRIARELHDDLAQHLTALHLKLDAPLPASAGGMTPREVANEELRELLGELGRAVDRLTWELRPVALDELGLRSAVGHYLAEWAALAQLPVDLEIDLDDRRLPPAVEATLFRVLQEAATNVLRHANASRLGVILRTAGDSVRLIVEDDGKGFLVNDVRPPFAASRQFGLLGMRERLALVRGELDVESAPSHGTTLFVSIPLAQGVGQP